MDIARARIQEISEIILFKNINTYFFLKKNIPIYLNFDEKLFSKNFRNIYNQIFQIIIDLNSAFLTKEIMNILLMRLLKSFNMGGKKKQFPLYMKKVSNFKIL